MLAGGMDFEAEGLLDGLDGEEERAARRELLEQLVEAGVTVDELKRAIAEERLALVPVELALAGEERGTYTHQQIAELSGVDPDFLVRQLQALGLPRPDVEHDRFTERDLDAAKQTAQFRAAGLPDEGLLDVARVIGQSMARVAEATKLMFGQAFLQAGDNERDLGLRYAEMARQLGPLQGPLLEYVLQLHLREQIRGDVIARAELHSGRLAGAERMGVCFADLVGFTRLGEEVPTDDLGAIAGRLTVLAGDVAEGPVRLIKTIGDAAMLVSPDVQALVDAALALVDAADAEGDGFPQLRAGVACGPALARGGDWYGRPVNLASRITDIARPGSVVVTAAVRDAVVEGAEDLEDGSGREAGGYHWRSIGRRRIKGVEGSVPLYRVRPARTADEPREQEAAA
jgi:adenylate cyclase